MCNNSRITCCSSELLLQLSQWLVITRNLVSITVALTSSSLPFILATTWQELPGPCSVRDSPVGNVLLFFFAVAKHVLYTKIMDGWIIAITDGKGQAWMAKCLHRKPDGRCNRGCDCSRLV